MNYNYVFVLGRESDLAYFELISVLKREQLVSDSSTVSISGNLVFANIEKDEKSVASIIESLGGTIKVFALIKKDFIVLGDLIAKYLITFPRESKITFGISSYDDHYDVRKVNNLGFSVKKRLKGKKTLRFLLLKESTELNSILSLKNDLIDKGIEFGIFKNGLGRLIALNNPEDWVKRDFGKPASDKFSGMIPPKLARMMANITLGEIQNSNIKTQNDLEIGPPASGWKLKIPRVLVVDPFCGSGNILLEAMMLGCNVVGSDKSEKAVRDTKENIEWLVKEYQISNIRYQIYGADATNFNFKQSAISNQPLAIITEPYLGEPKKFRPTYNAARGEYQKVKELYLKFLENLNKQLSNRATQQQSNLVICIIFPLVETLDQKRFSLWEESVDEIRKLGYTQIRNNFIYGRDYQVVKREIVLLKF